ncbi:hypothetical protein BD779DRAFT_1671598 [Infundibulicybe gibba]|nr:hypothetical protein BD779DRAFT_1671598 [Infundibulicybe gibba]
MTPERRKTRAEHRRLDASHSPAQSAVSPPANDHEKRPENDTRTTKNASRTQAIGCEPFACPLGRIFISIPPARTPDLTRLTLILLYHAQRPQPNDQLRTHPTLRKRGGRRSRPPRSSSIKRTQKCTTGRLSAHALSRRQEVHVHYPAATSPNLPTLASSFAASIDVWNNAARQKDMVGEPAACRRTAGIQDTRC